MPQGHLTLPVKKVTYILIKNCIWAHCNCEVGHREGRGHMIF